MLELKAALFGLKAFCSHMDNIYIKLELDNTSAIAYINNMGGGGGGLIPVFGNNGVYATTSGLRQPIYLVYIMLSQIGDPENSKMSMNRCRIK